MGDQFVRGEEFEKKVEQKLTDCGIFRNKYEDAAELEKVGRENDESSCAKRSKPDEISKKEKANTNAKQSGNGDQKQNKEVAKQPEPPKDYIHVRARRGRATDTHSLAESVRREKISERMKFVQDLVLGCNKSLQRMAIGVFLDIVYTQTNMMVSEQLDSKHETTNAYAEATHAYKKISTT